MQNNNPVHELDFIKHKGCNLVSLKLWHNPNNKGIGWVYWTPDWVATAGNAASSTRGSSWENQCL